MTLRKRLIALSMAAACAATAFAGAAFTDQSSIKVDSKVIDTLTEKNVIKGFEDGSFQPDKLVTRAQMAKMMFVLRTGSDDASYYAKDMTDTFADTAGTGRTATLSIVRRTASFPASRARFLHRMRL